MTKTALIAGATGMTGKLLLKKLLDSNHYNKVIVLLRKPVAIENPKAEVLIVNFDKPEDFSGKLIADDIFCCLGTTINKAKSKEAFKKVDLEYPLKLAEITKSNGASQFLVMSSMGANPDSIIFYSKVKGTLESELKKVGFNTLRIFRPSLLMGNREEFRLGERIGTFFYKFFSWLFIGKWRRYKGIASEAVALAMFKAAQLNDSGVIIYESDEISAL